MKKLNTSAKQKIAADKIQPYWDEWAKANGLDAVDMMRQIHAALAK